MATPHEIVTSPRASTRRAHALRWLEALSPGTEALIIGATQEAADDLARELTARRGAVFGIHRLTLNRLAGLIAAERATSQGLAYVNGLGAEAVAARALYALKDDQRLAALGDVATLPGLARAITSTRAELNHSGIEPERLASLGEIPRALAVVMEQFDQELHDAGLIDEASIIGLAIQAIRQQSARFSGMPGLMLDVAVDSGSRRDLIAAFAARSPHLLATVPAGDYRTQELLSEALGAEPKSLSDSPSDSLGRLQHYLFSEGPPDTAELDDSLSLTSAAGEMQEAVEIAREIHRQARAGIPFDRIGILLHTPARYGPYLEEALARAGIPMWFVRGTMRPEPGGRALLALLNCAAENFSARRFAEYLSLDQSPDPKQLRGSADESGTRFVPADPEFLPAASSGLREADEPESDPVPAAGGHSRAPWRWERILIDAAVINGRERWARRLQGYAAELRLRRSEVADDEPRAAAIERVLADLADLRETALRLVDRLSALPVSGTWAEWLAHLRELTTDAIRNHDPVLATLAEIEPMGPVGGISLDEVRLVLRERLGRLEAPQARRRYGAVMIAPTTYARGLEFDVVIMPGLAERMLPKKLIEDPLLPDANRRLLSGGLRTQKDQVAAERLALRIAAGAANKLVSFSYPRVDLDQGRPRVPSFYALEIMRAARGVLPSFDELARFAAGERRNRIGWPAPENAADAIDEAEFDLATLDQLKAADPAAKIGAAHYLLDSNPHLGRALRARARRWIKRWTSNDGLVDPSEQERAVLARHQLAARSYSPTALQHYAGCPYRFYLQAIMRLEPRELIEPLEAIDPLTRGGLFHEVQFETLTALRAANKLPVTYATIDEAYGMLEEQLKAIAERHRDELAPSIERVWLDGIESIRADLREWMRRMAEDDRGALPVRFELSFGLADRHRGQKDPASVAEPVRLDSGLSLRGSIDLVERSREGLLRVTDHKTGKARPKKNLIIGGGKILQPVLYGLAAESILEETVESGRLYFCTAAGNYEERIVALDEDARGVATTVVRTISAALNNGFLPAAPDKGECEFCDYRLICGPYEQTRWTDVKNGTTQAKERIKGLQSLREMR